MTPDRPSLAELAAGLRAATAQAVDESWLPDAIQTLILAFFARIFDRLEALIKLWQSGQLAPRPTARARPDPALQPRRATHPRASSSRATRASVATPGLRAAILASVRPGAGTGTDGAPATAHPASRPRSLLPGSSRATLRLTGPPMPRAKSEQSRESERTS